MRNTTKKNPNSKDLIFPELKFTEDLEYNHIVHCVIVKPIMYLMDTVH